MFRLLQNTWISAFCFKIQHSATICVSILESETLNGIKALIQAEPYSNSLVIAIYIVSSSCSTMQTDIFACKCMFRFVPHYCRGLQYSQPHPLPISSYQDLWSLTYIYKFNQTTSLVNLSLSRQPYQNIHLLLCSLPDKLIVTYLSGVQTGVVDRETVLWPTNLSGNRDIGLEEVSTSHSIHIQDIWRPNGHFTVQFYVIASESMVGHADPLGAHLFCQCRRILSNSF